jgi:hypothetical protein
MKLAPTAPRSWCTTPSIYTYIRIYIYTHIIYIYIYLYIHHTSMIRLCLNPTDLAMEDIPTSGPPTEAATPC